MRLFQILAQGHHGYPQPEDEYQSLVFADCCLRCGIHGPQRAPFRFKRQRRAKHSGFLQLNWVLDVFFAHAEIAADLSRAGMTGLSFGPIVDHHTGSEGAGYVQLKFPAIIACAETSRLPTVTCRPENEESHIRGLAGATRSSVATPYCGRVKHHAPTTLRVQPGAVHGAPDVFQTEEWFGSGAEAHRLTLGSERFVELIRQRGWRGLEFRAVGEDGSSERAASLPKRS